MFRVLRELRFEGLGMKGLALGNCMSLGIGGFEFWGLGVYE